MKRVLRVGPELIFTSKSPYQAWMGETMALGLSWSFTWYPADSCATLYSRAVLSEESTRIFKAPFSSLAFFIRSSEDTFVIKSPVCTSHIALSSHIYMSPSHEFAWPASIWWWLTVSWKSKSTSSKLLQIRTAYLGILTDLWRKYVA